MLMSVAVNEENKLVNINDVKRGLDCNCFCFECGEPVIAKKGLIMEHHFAHASNKDSCLINPETLLHKFAKQVIDDEKMITLPSLTDIADNEVWQFDQVIQELTMGAIRPDLVASNADKTLFIEVAVTSFIDEHKANIIKTLSIPTIEIDCRPLLDDDISIPSDEAKAYILNEIHNKRWIYPTFTTVSNNTSDNDIIEPDETTQTSESHNFDRSYESYRFTINHVWVDVKVFASGMVTVKCVQFNHDIKEMLKGWKREGGGEYSPKYKTWNYFNPFSITVFERLVAMDSTPKN